MNDILIRKAKPGDEIGIAQIRKEGLIRKNWLYTGGNKAPSKEKIKKMRKDLSTKNPENICLVAVDKSREKIIGSIFGGFKKDGRLRHRIELGWGVHPDYQGRGIGTRLLETMLQQAKKKGFKRAEAEMAIENIASWKLALKFGFKIEGVKKRALLTDDNRYIDTYIVGKLI
ncbi:MAG: GNAT family N-acetyltransferase [Nanoarchaeota archaeon]